MSQRMTVGAGLSLCILLLTLHDASGQTAERRSQGSPVPADAVAEAQITRVGSSRALARAVLGREFPLCSIAKFTPYTIY
jgi:hypothetical protein